MDEIPTWSRHHTGLLGDAAHPVLPFGFSGASVAIEDALTLATLLPSDVQPGQIEGRLEIYEEMRMARVERVTMTARKIARDEEDVGFMKGYMRWLGEYDAV